jgi:hypothetical protein
MKKTFILLTLCFNLGFFAKAQSTDASRLNQAYAFISQGHPHYNPQQGFIAFSELATESNLDAMNALGILYSKGIGTKPDIPKAVEWYQKAASLGYSQAWYNLGTLYKEGVGIPQDFKAAYNAFSNGASVLQAPCLYAKGYMHYKGLGCQQDYQSAAALFREAVKWGSPAAAYMLGLCYRNGYGVTVNVDSARTLLAKALNSGYAGAKTEMQSPMPENMAAVPGHAPASAPTLPAIKQTVKGAQDGIAGRYSGYIVKYDYSKTHVIKISPLSLNLVRQDSSLTGQWIEDDTVATFIEGKIKGNQVSFSDTRYERTNHYSPNKGEEMEFKDAVLNLTQQGDTVKITGTLQQWNTERREPGKPLVINLMRVEAAPLKSSSKALAFAPGLESNTGMVVYPNPMSSGAKVSFSLDQQQRVTLQIAGLNGVVYHSQESTLEAGPHELSFNTQALVSGAYILKLSYGAQQKSTLIIKQ